MIYFETKRLIFRDWQKTDLPYFITMNMDKEVMKYFPNILSENESISFYKRIVEEIENSGYGLYAVELKEDHQFIGFIGFHYTTFDVHFAPCIEIGWRLRKEFWHCGYASEGALACLNYGFYHLEFKEVYSFTAKINIPSKRVMQKIGMERVGTFMHPMVDKCDILSEHVLYKVKKKLYCHNY